MLAIDDPLSSASAISQKTLQIRWMPKLIIPALTAIKWRCRKVRRQTEPTVFRFQETTVFWPEPRLQLGDLRRRIHSGNSDTQNQTWRTTVCHRPLILWIAFLRSHT
jgi:hypothetical protein